MLRLTQMVPTEYADRFAASIRELGDRMVSATWPPSDQKEYLTRSLESLEARLAARPAPADETHSTVEEPVAPENEG